MFPYNRFLMLLSYAKAGKAPRGLRLQLAQAASFFAIMVALVLVTLVEDGLAWCFGDWRYISGHGIFLTCMNGFFAIFILGIIIWPLGRFRSRWHEAKSLVAALTTPRLTTAPALHWLEPSSRSLSQRGRPIGYLPNLYLVPSETAWWRPIGYVLVIAYGLGYLQLTVPSEFFSRAQAQSVIQFNAAQAVGSGSWNLVYFIIGGAFLGFLLHICEARRVWADAEGLRWRSGWQWERLPWNEIRALGVYPAYSQKGAPLVYVIASERHLIVWTSPRYDTLVNRNVTERILALAMAYTHLSVRDLTALGQHSAMPVRHKARAGQTLALHAPVAPASDSPAAVRLMRRSLATALALGLILAALVSAPLVTETVLEQHLWPAYLASLPQQIEQQRPIFVDALQQRDGLWPSYSANFGNPTTYAYSSMGYTMSGPGAAYAPALLPTIYHAVAIQVTVHNLGLPGYRGGSPLPIIGAGIVMRANAESGGYIHYCAFEIDGLGRWGASDAYAAGDGNGTSPYIQTGPNNVNTIFVIARGLLYSMYVNGHFLGTYADDFGCAPVGQIGLVNDSGNAAVSFTDFKVWSVTAPPAFNYS
jgi:hypothetical protein